MTCIQCGRALPPVARFCSHCGAPQPEPTSPEVGPDRVRRLLRPRGGRVLGGVCGGIGDYYEVDPVLIRLVWAVGSLVTGLIPGAIAYLVAWIIIPEAEVADRAPVGRRLRRSSSDRWIGGVCGGIAEYFGSDTVLIRVLWVILSIIPGCVLGGIAAYLLAWLIMPRELEPVAARA